MIGCLLMDCGLWVVFVGTRGCEMWDGEEVSLGFWGFRAGDGDD